MLWRRNTARRRERSVQCYYCGGDSIVDAPRKLSDWRCPRCEALNILDERGEIADDVPQKYQRDCPSPIAALTNRPGVQQLASPFCSVCANNHALLAKSLASYMPDDDDPDYKMYEKALPAYRASLEERFPPLCASCAPAVKVRLERNNYVAKATALGSFLSRTHGHRRSTYTFGWQVYVRAVVWAARGVLWWAGLLITLHFFARSISEQSTLHIAWLHYVDVPPRWLLFTIFGAFWHPAGLRAFLHPELKLHGRAEYNRLQIAVQAMRFFRLFVLERLQMHPSVAIKVDALLLCLSIAHVVLSWQTISLSEPARVTLRDSTDLTVPADDFALHDETLLPTTMHVSPFEDRAMMNALRSVDHDLDRNDDYNDNDSTTIDDDDMDWQPAVKHPLAQPSPLSTFSTASVQPIYARSTQIKSSPFATVTTNGGPPSNGALLGRLGQPAREETVLARQKFFAPEKPTGLESLFSAAVRLDDEPLVVRSLKQVRRAGVDVGHAILGAAALLLALLPAAIFAPWQVTEHTTIVLKCAAGLCLHAATLHRSDRLASLWSTAAVWLLPALVTYAGHGSALRGGTRLIDANSFLGVDTLFIGLAATNLVLLALPLLRTPQSRARRTGRSRATGTASIGQRGHWQAQHGR